MTSFRSILYKDGILFSLYTLKFFINRAELLLFRLTILSLLD